MSNRSTSSAVRWVVLAAVVAGSGLLAFAGIRNAIAQHLGASSNPDQWLRAAELEPSNAENWHRLGRYRQNDFEHSDLPLAISYYRRATAINPASATYWMDLADAYEAAGNIAQAEQSLRTAQQVYPISAEVAWRFGNFLLRQARIDEAFAEIHRAISVDPALTAVAISQCWRSTPDINRILKFALPQNSEAYWGAIDYFVGANAPDAAMAVWKRLAADRSEFPISRVFPLIDLLLIPGHEDDAEVVWQNAIKSAGLKEPPGSAGSLVWNGGFEEELLNGGLSWRYRPTEGANVDFDSSRSHSGARSLRVDFDGTTNIDFGQIWELVIVKPNTHYRFSAFIESMDLTTDSGIRFQIVGEQPDRLTPNIIGTQPWAMDTIDFTTGPNTRLLRIVLRRLPSDKLGNKIRGTAWIDDVSLVPSLAATMDNE